MFWQNIPSILSKINSTNLNNLAGGWTKVLEAIALISAVDAPTYTVSTSIDTTAYLNVGMKLKLTQTSVKYFFITAITSTTITLYGGTDSVLTSATITEVYFSVHKSPYGFNTNPDKWTIKVSLTTSQAINNPAVNGLLYQITNAFLNIPIGLFDISYSVNYYATNSVNISIRTIFALSTSTTSITDNELSNKAELYSTVVGGTMRANKKVLILAPTKYYLLVKAQSQSYAVVAVDGSDVPIMIKAVCAYL